MKIFLDRINFYKIKIVKIVVWAKGEIKSRLYEKLGGR